MIDDQVFRSCTAMSRERLASGDSLELIVSFMKDSGFAPMDCIKGVLEITDLTLSEATEVVTLSPAWQNVWNKQKGS